MWKTVPCGICAIAPRASDLLRTCGGESALSRQQYAILGGYQELPAAKQFRVPSIT